jgi:hypothetical protein
MPFQVVLIAPAGGSASNSLSVISFMKNAYLELLESCIVYFFGLNVMIGFGVREVKTLLIYIFNLQNIRVTEHWHWAPTFVN